MKINCIVIDDEPLARRGIKEYINDIAFLNFAEEFDNPVKAMEALSKPAENLLLFLDIQMPRITGLAFFKTLQHPPPVIFTTAYPQYALDGFDVNALDYLVKPFSFERFLKAALKAKAYYEIRTAKIFEQEADQQGSHFYIKADNKLVKMLLSEILFVEALQNYVCIHALDRKYITYLTFKAVEEYLPKNAFIKTHKSFIVAVDKIESIEGSDITIGRHHIPISRNLKDEVMEKLLHGKYLKR